jgi:hypothetical protein
MKNHALCHDFVEIFFYPKNELDLKQWLIELAEHQKLFQYYGGKVDVLDSGDSRGNNR